MNQESAQVLAKRISDIDCTCMGKLDGHLALGCIVGMLTGYLPGNVNIPEATQLYILGRIESILKSSEK